MTTTKYDELKAQAQGQVCAVCHTEPRIANMDGTHVLRCDCFPDGPSLVTKATHEQKALAKQYEQNATAENPEVNNLATEALRALVPEATATELQIFRRLCEGLGANPFLNEAHAWKQGGKLIFAPGYQLFIKRASQVESYGGFESGVVVDVNGEQKFVQGTLVTKGQTLLGGWCKVYRKDRVVPTFEVVSLDDFDKKQNEWNTKKPFMIEKTAISHAHSRAFPDAAEAIRETAREVAAIEGVDVDEGNDG